MTLSRLLLLLALASALGGSVHAESTFDLAGPPLEIKVTRNGKTLPISEVPNLQAGDRLWLHADLPQEQTARYLMVATFLRGSTNPPPDDWFTRAETWNRQVRDRGVSVTVPQNAQQMLLFLAPETGGDFVTLRANVRARPGAFVRAAQDLNQANLDRSRLDAYLAAVTTISTTDPAALKDKSKLLARSLNIKLDSECFQKPAVQQLSCLTQDQAGLVLDDGHTESMVATLTSGASADLIGQLSATSMAGAGAYSPYVGAIVDVVRIMNGIHTAQYQYIPALVAMNQERLDLKLNSPPSFSNPKSVLTVGLPAVGIPQLPPLRAMDPAQTYCLETPSLVLPVYGAPLVYSTKLAHDFVLHIEDAKGPPIDLPARPDPSRGGFVIDTHTLTLASMDSEATGILRGYWGFQSFDGPSFRLQNAHSSDWNLLASNRGLVVGREETLNLEANTAACVDAVSVRDHKGKLLKATYKLVKPNELQVQAQLENASPGMMTLLLKQAGLSKQDQVQVQAYPEAAHVMAFSIHAGDPTGELEGSRLEEVSELQIQDVIFTPVGLKHDTGQETLTLKTAGTVAGLKAGAIEVAQVVLKDGRRIALPITIEQPRPTVTLLSKNVDLGETAAPSPIRLASPDELPQDGALTFVFSAGVPSTWERSEKIEVATADHSFHTFLSVEDGSLTLQNSTTVRATLNPVKSFGASAFGPLRFRPVDASGAQGDWQPLGDLVRIPTLKEVRCPASVERECTLTGSNLFLLDSVSSSPTFRNSVSVPLGFAGSELNVPRPNGTLLFIKLRDDPRDVNLAALPVLPE